MYFVINNIETIIFGSHAKFLFPPSVIQCIPNKRTQELVFLLVLLKMYDDKNQTSTT